MLNLGLGGISFVQDSAALAFQLGGGVKYKLSDNVDVDLGYRFKDISNVTNLHTTASPPQTVVTNSYTSHNVQLGVTFHF